MRTVSGARMLSGVFCLLRGAVAALLMLLATGPSAAFAGDWKAGAARVKITPARPIWMSGYASRDHAAEGTLIDLWAKALVLESPQGERVALVSLDIVGIDRDTAQAVCRALREAHGLERRQIALATSHTHTGPVVGRTLMAMYFLDESNRQLVADYTAQLEGQIVSVVGDAIQGLAPARLAWGNGHSSVAVNRRTNVEADVPRLREQGLLKGPVDHDVPVLSVRNLDGRLTAVVFGYACHATVLGTYEWSGDYPGFAQIELEKLHPDAVALFFAGCGGDQNPLPRRTVELAQEHGRSLARSVESVLAGPMNTIDGELSSSYSEVDIALDTLPTPDELKQQSSDSNKYVAQRAKILLDQLAAGQPLSPTYPFPIQLWRLGPSLEWMFLGGEVTVDYAIRIKHELGRETTWVAAYANDVMAYIPSRRVLKEGGYEGGGAMIYYGLPTVWAPDVEERIIRGVHEVVRGK